VDTAPVDPVIFNTVMKTTRRRRKFFFSTVLLYIPALVITHRLSPTDKSMGTVFGIWVFILIIATFLAAISRCPRCGNYFHIHGMTLLILRRCLHCQLHICANSTEN
jgi:hypothetical protein